MAIRGRLKRYFLLLGLFLFLSGFPILIGVSRYVHAEYYKAKMLQSLEKTLVHWPTFVEDLKILDNQSTARTITRTQNAAAFLSDRVSWNPEDDIVTELQQPAKRARALLRRYPKWSTEPAELLQLQADPELKSIDTTWIRELSRFDFLDFSVTPKQKQKLDQLASANVVQRIEILASLPLPDLLQALDLATVSVLQANFSEKSNAAILAELAMVEKLFQLFQTSPTLVDQSLAVAALGRQQSLADALKIKDVSTVPQEMRLRIRRVAWMWAQVLLHSPLKEFEASLAEVRPYMKTTNFLCGGSDPVGTHAIFKDVLRSSWPLAPDFQSALAREESFLKETSDACGTTLTNIILSLPPPKHNPLEFEIPYLKTIVFSIIQTIAVPRFSRQYDDLKN